MHLRSLLLLTTGMGVTFADLAVVCGVSPRVFTGWCNCEAAPRGYNRRRDVLRDLARFVAEKAGES